MFCFEMGHHWQVQRLSVWSFTVYMDNNPFSCVLSTAKLDTTEHFRLVTLAAFDFKIIYKPGVKSVDADRLLRLPHNTVAPHQEEISSKILHTICSIVHCPVIETDCLSAVWGLYDFWVFRWRLKTRTGKRWAYEPLDVSDQECQETLVWGYHTVSRECYYALECWASQTLTWINLQWESCGWREEVPVGTTNIMQEDNLEWMP